MKSIDSTTLLCLTLSGAPALALFESDKELSEKARITMAEALKTAQKKVPGKPVELTMGKDDERVVYKIEIIDKDKNTKKVYIDEGKARGNHIILGGDFNLDLAKGTAEQAVYATITRAGFQDLYAEYRRVEFGDALNSLC